jgi:large subunit ribosomal protein L29
MGDVPFLRLKEIREMDADKREAKLHELRVELSKLRAMIHAGGALENPSRVKEIRRAIARVITVQNENIKRKR